MMPVYCVVKSRGHSGNIVIVTANSDTQLSHGESSRHGGNYQHEFVAGR